MDNWQFFIWPGLFIKAQHFAKFQNNDLTFGFNLRVSSTLNLIASM